jgi:hypothetical protein
MENTIALIQGIYFFITGVWPIVSMKTFLAITSPKTDLWLAKTVGLVLASIAATLMYAAITAGVNPAVTFLAISSAAMLAVVEFIYVSRRVISPVYLGDAFAELILIGWWSVSLLFA